MVGLPPSPSTLALQQTQDQDQDRTRRFLRQPNFDPACTLTTTMTPAKTMMKPLKMTTTVTTILMMAVVFLMETFGGASAVEGQVRVLTPPYFNLAFGKNIDASSTCGVNSSSPELFCRLTGVAGDTKESDLRITINSGQLCEECDPSVESLSHHAGLAIDGTERWWQSPPLSRGMEYNEVNVTIDLEQEFLVVYVFIKMANSPRPGVWALEKSIDFGKTWHPWQYFAGNPNECLQFFNTSSSVVPDDDDEVICTTKFSKVVPLENGEIIVSLVDDRPNALNFSNSQKLQDWTKATSVRLRLLQTKTLLGHLMAVRRQDPTVTRRYFYSIKDISIGGRCVCNGHAERCDKRDATQPNKLFCQCHHNTCGSQCEHCCSGFVQKKWQRVTTNKDFMCEACNCHNHTDKCIYDPEIDAKKMSVDIHGNYDGGGVCQDCTHNTMGINCEQCIDGFYRPFNVPKNVPNVCQPCQCQSRFTTGSCEEGSGRCMCKLQYTGQNCDRCNHGYHNFPECLPCDCHINGTSEGICDVGGGQCPCKVNYQGRKCDTCRPRYYNFPECNDCGCDRVGSQGPDCQVTTGQCQCQPGFNGRNCSTCAVGYHGFPACTLCNCEVTGCTEDICNSQTGRCICKPNYAGQLCDRCVPGYYGYPYCIECGCATPGSSDTRCHANGQCVCKRTFSGPKCNKCAPGFYNYPECTECNCYHHGSLGQTCDQTTGQCECRTNFDGLMCDKCKENFYRFPRCVECNCNPAGAIHVPGQPLGGCGPGAAMSDKLCECKERVIGNICDTCKTGFWDLDSNNPLGCRQCVCHSAGTVGGINVCDGATGQCMCKVDVVGRNCDQCKDGTYGLSAANPFGCKACDCNVGGSVSMSCNKKSGQCNCKPRVFGMKCDKPLKTYFFPTLHHQKYEIEEGHRPGGGKVYFAFNQRVFPEFSWKGYAIMSEKQPEVLIKATIQKPSLYRLLVRYHNQHEREIKGKITLTPRIPTDTDTEQMAMVTFRPSDHPSFTRTTDVSSILVLNPGRWTLSIQIPSEEANENLLLDYLVLVPQHYYEATVLQDRISKQCPLGSDKGPCLHYKYPELKSFSTILGIQAYVEKNGKRSPANIFSNDTVVSELKIKGLVDLNENQKKLKFDVEVPRPGIYILVTNYYNPGKSKHTTIQVQGPSGISGSLVLLECSYSTLCRQVAKVDNNTGFFNFTSTTGTVTLLVDKKINAFIESVTAIPFSEWNQGYIKPTIVCIKVNGVCAGSQYSNPAGFDRIEAESEPNQFRIATELPPDIWDKSVGLVKLNSSMPLDMYGQVKTGAQVLVAHYYQPSQPEARIEVTVYSKDRIYTGYLSAHFCPSQTGCRGIITLGDKGQYHADIIDPELKISLNSSSDADIWLDYIMLVPFNKYEPDMLVFQPIDKSADFLSECIDDSLNLKVGKEKLKLCRTRLFALTTDYNNGALSCKCSVDGSLSFSCRAFGGQCKCRPNIIGRDCSACRSGFYGFPHCKRCRCRVGKCHPVDGTCVCPPFVTGAQCDTCVEHTFGYDPYVGCQECNCHSYGVVERNLNCSQRNGQCNCRPGIEGVHCDACQMGHYAFPHCRQCDCEAVGTEEQMCDQATGRCLCKENTERPNCRTCRAGAYYLEKENPKGCTSCFCFGTTSSCVRSNLKWAELSDMKNWTLPNTVDAIIEEGSSEISAIINVVHDESKPLYWSAPARYLGNKVTSYGGQLRFSVEYDSYEDANGDNQISEEAADVVLMGGNISIVHSMEPTTHQTDFAVELKELNFKHDSSNGPVLRSQFMMILVNLESLYIKASKSSSSTRIKLSNVYLDIAREDGSGRAAYTVEQCHCPSSYEGSSCEKCAPGHYRHQTSPFLGICSPCQCNGHADGCDPTTGQCFNCRDNTEGRHCEKCKAGYFGDPATGGCRMCTCPLDSESNNFADTCYANLRGLVTHCDCHPGYSGNHCERCAAGYFGQPTAIGQRCGPCDCSGNIDATIEGSCDQGTGVCRLCTNNSTGSNCELCKHWWYGDAVRAKNCKPCTCDRCGALTCGEYGTCECKENIVGINCDRCLPNHWGYNDCNGCKRCDCATAAVTEQCDGHSGQCECRDGVIGQKCDHCQSNYWNYQPSGCQKCQCMSEGSVTCDSDTGACICQPGFRGVNCSQCDDGWVHIPGRGCVICDKCTKFLTDELYELTRNITVTKRELHSVTVGVTALNALRDIGQSVKEYQPKVTALLKGENPNMLSLDEQRDGVQALNNQADILKTEAKSSAVLSHDLLEGLEPLMIDTKVADDLSMDVRHLVRVTVNYLKSLTTYTGPSINLESYIKRANILIEEMNSVNHTVDRGLSSNELIEAQKLSEVVSEYNMQLHEPESQFNMTKSNVDNFRENLYDLQGQSRDAGDKSSTAINLVQELNKTMTESARNGVNSTLAKINQVVAMTMDMLEDLYLFDDEVKDHSVKLDKQAEELMSLMKDLQGFINDPVDEIYEDVGKAIQHSDEIQRELHDLDSIYVNTKFASDSSVKAANSYKNIVMSIEDATNATHDALNISQITHEMSEGIGDIAVQSKWTSREIKLNASAAYDATSTELDKSLKNAEGLGNMVEEINNEIAVKLEQFYNLEMENYTASASAIAMEAMSANEKAKDVLVKAESIRPEDRTMMSSIPQHHSTTKEAVTNGLRQVKQARELLPNITTMMQYILDNKDMALSRARNASLNVKELRKKIELARSQANQILVGLKFSDTSVRLRNPPHVDSSGSYTKVSLHVKTQSRNGLITYIGGPKLEAQTQDYLSLEVVDGRVMLKFDLGSGPGIIYHTKFISDDKWHLLEAERIGTVGSLKVSTDGEETVQINGTSGGTNSVLMLPKSKTFFFVGGFPQSVELPDDVTRFKFEGSMEKYIYNDYPMGLWDFISAENNREGAIAWLIKQKTFDGYRFDGESFIELKSKNNVQEGFDISLAFNTFKPNGLVLFMYDTSQDFASIDMRDGRIAFQYDLGGGRAFMISDERYNDGKWHQVQIKREYKKGALILDSGAAVFKGEAPGRMKMLAVKKVFVGGYNDYLEMPRNNVSNFGFDGCIKSLQFNTDSRGFANKILAHKVIPGCPEQIARGVNFPPPGKNYVSKYLETSDTVGFHLTMKIRTEQSDGLLMFAKSPSNGRHLAIFVSAGYITVIRDEGSEVKSKIGNYNDGSWHYISVVNDRQELTLNINDIDMAVGQSTSGLSTDVQLYFGGIPDDLSLPGGVPGMQFFGCIEDVTINGLFFNFARSKHSPGVRLNICPLDISTTIPSTSVVPATPPPTLPPGQCALPKVPTTANKYSASGHRFGATSNASRLEFTRKRKNNKKTKISLEFQTMVPDGVLFYGSDKRHNDFISIYLKEGKVKFAYNCGSGTALLQSMKTYNDGQWHKVLIDLTHNNGTMSVDRGTPIRGTAPGRTTSLDIRLIYSFGGLSPQNQKLAKKNFRGINIQFIGCLKNIKANKRKLDELQSHQHNMEPCSDKAEFGTFFSNGFVKVYDKYHIGTDLSVTMEVRPRSMSGVLFAVHGKEDFMLVQLVNGKVQLSFDNGNGIITASSQPKRNNQICNGQWHKIKVSKSKTIATLELDGVKLPESIGKLGASSADTNHPLYIGGIPAGATPKGVQATSPYVGCIRNIKLQDVTVVLAAGEPSGELKFGFCPTT